MTTSGAALDHAIDAVALALADHLDGGGDVRTLRVEAAERLLLNGVAPQVVEDLFIAAGMVLAGATTDSLRLAEVWDTTVLTDTAKSLTTLLRNGLGSS